MSNYHRESDNDPLFKAQRKTYLDHYGWCRICGEWVPRDLRAIDHIIPMWRYEGEYWHKENWQMLCPSCNRKKTAIEGRPEIE